MQPALSTPFAPPPIPAWAELSENSRLGVTSKNPALYLRHEVCKSTTALGLQASLPLNGARSRCSGEQFDPDLGLYYLRARYYNPLSGRFMSGDPNNPGPFDAEGNPVDPKMLHKYLYAGGDPINGLDPTGRGIVEASIPIPLALVKAGAYIALAGVGLESAVAFVCAAEEIGDWVEAAKGNTQVTSPPPILQCHENPHAPHEKE